MITTGLIGSVLVLLLVCAIGATEASDDYPWE